MSPNLSSALLKEFAKELALLGTWKPPMSHLLVNSDTRIMREPAMVITAQSTERMVTMMVHIVSAQI